MKYTTRSNIATILLFVAIFLQNAFVTNICITIAIFLYIYNATYRKH